jgi:outer membrane protein TolC
MVRRIAQAMLVLLAAMPGGCSDRQDDAFRRYAVTGLAPASQPSSAKRFSPQALTELTESSTLWDYLTYAALNNPGLEAAFHRWQAAVQRVAQMRALPDPQLSYRYYTDRMGMGPDMELRQAMGISQMIPWPGKLISAAEMAEQEAAAEFQRFQAERFKLVQEVKQAYYEYYYLGRIIAVTEENSRLMAYLEGVARTRYAAAAGSHPDVIRAQVELGKLQNELTSLRDMRSSRAARLNAAMNRPIDAALPIPKQIDASTPTLQEQRLLERLAADNPQLRAMDREVAARGREVDLATQGFLPDFMAGVEWMDATARPGSEMSAEDNWVVMAGVSLPLWLDKNTAAVREARARRLAAQGDRAQMANMLQADLKMAAYEYRDARRRISLYRDTLLPKARQSFQATEAAYKTGGATFSDLADSERMWLEFQLAYERSLSDCQQRLADIQALIGQLGDENAELGLEKGPDQPPAAGGK